MAVFVFLLVLSALIFIHELGHFLAARSAKIKVEEFGFGYPPKAFKLFTKFGTDFTLNWIPFGGFVRMKGEDPDPNRHTVKGDFYYASLWQRMIVILAGVFANFLLGIVLFTIVFGRMGIPQVITQPRVAQIAPNSPAAEAGIPQDVEITGLKFGDNIVETPDVESVISVIKDHQGEMVQVITTGPCVELVCSQDVQEFEAYLRTTEEIPEGEGSLGVAFTSVVFIHYPAWEMPVRSMVYGVKEAFGLGRLIVDALGQMVVGSITQGKLPSDIAGPVGIVHQAQVSGLFNQGFLSILSFAGMLSINLAIINILPIPPLDGGRAVFIFVELLLNKRKSRTIEHYFNYAGYILLMLLIVAITARDIWRIFVP